MRKSLLTKYVEDESEDEDQLNGNKTKSGVEAKEAPQSSLQSVQSNSFNIKDVEEQDELDIKRYEIQCELNNQGASDLVVDLFMSEVSNKVFKENVLLAIALLEGGNTQVQVQTKKKPHLRSNLTMKCLKCILFLRKQFLTVS